MTATPRFVVDLFLHRPAFEAPVVDPALTIQGLIDKGARGFPKEWTAVLEDRFASRALFDAIQKQPGQTRRSRDLMIRRFLVGHAIHTDEPLADASAAR